MPLGLGGSTTLAFNLLYQTSLGQRNRHRKVHQAAKDARGSRFAVISAGCALSIGACSRVSVQQGGDLAGERAAWSARVRQPANWRCLISRVPQRGVGAASKEQVNDHRLTLDRCGVQRRGGPVTARRIGIHVDAAIEEETHDVGLSAHAREYECLFGCYSAIRR